MSDERKVPRIEYREEGRKRYRVVLRDGGYAEGPKYRYFKTSAKAYAYLEKVETNITRMRLLYDWRPL